MTRAIPTLNMPEGSAAKVRSVLYLGTMADEICHLLMQHVGDIDIRYEDSVPAALLQLRAARHDIVIVDLRHNDPQMKLVLPLVRQHGPHIKVVVISTFNSVSSYLGIPSVNCVLAAPVREGQLLRVVGLKAKKHHAIKPEIHDETPVQTVPPKVTAAPVERRRGIIEIIANRGMVIVSTLYKRSAFVLLITLFSAFLFYGFLIAFFLLSTSWGAPMTLARGHELVNKVEKEVTDLRIALSQTSQRLTEERSNRLKTIRDLSDAKVMVSFAADTVKKEIKSLGGSQKTITTRLARLEKLRAAAARQMGKGGAQGRLDDLYNKRLIDKNAYQQGGLGMLELDQRLAGIESDIETLTLERDNFSNTMSLLQSLKDGLSTGGPMVAISAAAGGQLALAQQAVEAKATLDNATERLNSADQMIAELSRNHDVLQAQLTQIEQSALARAIHKRIDVVFVPYANQYRFKEGSALYSCTWTVIWCRKAGVVGPTLPGEVASVHPFFGKPIRGFFAEANLADAESASRDIIHAVRPPFFF